MPIPASVEAMCAQQLAHRAATVAADLRKLAERVEQAAGRIDRVGAPGIRSYAAVAADIQHAVMNELPNLRLDGLTTAAQDADAARAAERTAAAEF
jgi:hypothetical protein